MISMACAPWKKVLEVEVDATTRTRSISGAIALVILLPPLIWGGYIGFGLLLIVAGLISAGEVVMLGRKSGWSDQVMKEWLWIAVVAGLLTLGMLKPHPMVNLALTLGIVVWFTWMNYRVTTDHLQRVRVRRIWDEHIALFFAWVYPGLLTLLWIRQHEDGLFWIFYVLIIAFSADMGGYFVGRRYGKEQLAPTISEKKTVEGAVGGVVCAVIAGFVYAFSLGGEFAGIEPFSGSAFFLHIILPAMLAFFAIAGDLFESMIKRRFGAKDSGGILPGHGGLLDRLDSIMFVAIILNVMLQLIKFVLTG